MFLNKLRVLKSHGKQFIPNLAEVELTERFRGRPELSSGVSLEQVAPCIECCPTKAISYDDELSLDLSKCVFCGECAASFPLLVRFTNDWHTSSNVLENLIIRPSTSKIEFKAEHTREIIHKRFGRALKLRSVCAGGDASTEMEMNASMNVNFDFSRYGVDFVASPRHADGLVISGPITKAMDEALRICYEAMPEPKLIILSGTDAVSGGLFAGSEAINRGFLREHKPDLYIPGNPVHPLTFIDAIMTLCDRKKR